MNFIEIKKGLSPLILTFPHTGTVVPDEVKKGLNKNGRNLADTDWHIHRLYAGLVEDATTVSTSINRYVIDCNRNPKGVTLYQGQNTTTLVPMTDFEGKRIYDQNLDEAEITHRIAAYHKPYHQAIEEQIERVKSIHGFVILYDCHSIRSRVPFLFDGLLPDFSIGTNDSKSCAVDIEEQILRICAFAPGYTHVLNGRFKGGWTTRNYGKPIQNIHAIQMELTQSTYMNEVELRCIIPEKFSSMRIILSQILDKLTIWRPRRLK